MRFEKNYHDYTERGIIRASKYLKEAIERMEDKLEEITGCDVYIESSHVSLFSNYIEFSDPETFETIFKIRISDHANNEGWTAQDVDIRINERSWSEVKKEILRTIKENFK